MIIITPISVSVNDLHGIKIILTCTMQNRTGVQVDPQASTVGLSVLNYFFIILKINYIQSNYVAYVIKEWHQLLND